MTELISCCPKDLSKGMDFCCYLARCGGVTTGVRSQASILKFLMWLNYLAFLLFYVYYKKEATVHPFFIRGH
jgi:hypothetical protein